MKHILITGINSYLGKSFEKYIRQFPEYTTVSISMRDGSWRDYDFDGIDVIYHVAGLAHSDNGRISSEKRIYIIKSTPTSQLSLLKRRKKRE